MTKRQSTAKAKKTFSLSQRAVNFLCSQAKRRRSSASAVVEELIYEKQVEAARTHLDEEMSAYYDSLTEGQMAEEQAWGEAGAIALASVMDEGSTHEHKPTSAAR